MVSFTGTSYTYTSSEIPFGTVARVLDSDGDPVMDVTRGSLLGTNWFTFADPDGTPAYHLRTTTASLGPIRYTTRRYRLVDADTEETVAELVERRVGPFKLRFDVESASGSRLATVESPSRWRGAARLVPLSWLVVPALTLRAATPDGTRLAVARRRATVLGEEYVLRRTYTGDFPWVALFAVLLLRGRAGTAGRAPIASGQ